MAQEFAGEFMRQPDLRKIYEEFKRDHLSSKPKGSLRDLARQLGAKNSFRKLIAKFAQVPGFKEVSAPFMRFPEIREAIHNQSAALRVQGVVPVAASALAPASLRGNPVGRLGVMEPRRGIGTRTAAAESATAGPREETISNAGRSPQARGEAAPSVSAGPSDHDAAPKLAAIGGAGNDRDAKAALASLCYKNDPAITQAECRAISSFLGDYELWEACVKADQYETCRDLCSSRPELSCGASPNFYDLCMAAAAENCAERCRQIAGCSMPPAESPTDLGETAQEDTGPGSATSAQNPDTGGGNCRPQTYLRKGSEACPTDGNIRNTEETCTRKCQGGILQPPTCRVTRRFQCYAPGPGPAGNCPPGSGGCGGGGAGGAGGRSTRRRQHDNPP